MSEKTRVCADCGEPCYRKAQRCGPCSRTHQSLTRTKPKDTPPVTVTEASAGKGFVQLYVEREVNDNVRTLDELVRVAEIDTSVWNVDKWVVNKTETSTGPRYQVRAWLKRVSPAVDLARKEIEALKKMAKISIRPSDFKPRPDGMGCDHMLELSIPDLHLGKLAWSKETGYADYDIHIAEKLFLEAVDTLILRTAMYEFDSILFTVGNDFLHSDTKAGMTFRGTVLDTDSRYYKAFAAGRDILIKAILRLRSLAPVHVVIVQGNHDTMSAWHMGDSLECYFHNEADVFIDNEPRQRKYVQFGEVGLMLTHGDKTKLDRLPLIFATESPGVFGTTSFREIHTGHIHKTKVDEHNGVRVRISPALCSPDAWHSENGFVGAKRAAEAYVWHRREGLVQIAFYNVEDQ